MAFGKRESLEFFDLSQDADCVTNLANDPASQKTIQDLQQQMFQELLSQNDRRMIGKEEYFEKMRNSKLKEFMTSKVTIDEQKMKALTSESDGELFYSWDNIAEASAIVHPYSKSKERLPISCELELACDQRVPAEYSPPESGAEFFSNLHH